MEIPWKLLKNHLLENHYRDSFFKRCCINNVHGGKKKTMKPKTKEQSEDKITKDLRIIFRLKPMKQSKTE